jgi:peptidoglycan/LPS O-acetylase OafA/YrhL
MKQIVKIVVTIIVFFNILSLIHSNYSNNEAQVISFTNMLNTPVPFSNLNTLVKNNPIFRETDVVKGGISNLPENHECEKKTNLLIGRIFNSTAAIPEEYTNAVKFVIYSGTSINDYGDYYACKKLDFSTFYIIQIGIINPGMPTPMTFRMGLCYFKECDTEYLQQAKGHLISYISKATNTTMSEDAISFINSDIANNKYKDKYYGGMVAVFTILVLLLFLFVFHEVWKILKSSDKKKTVKVRDPEKQPLHQASEELDRQIKEEDSMIWNFFSYFNASTSLRKLWEVKNTNKSMEHLRVFDGVRVLSTCWVVFGHTFYIPLSFGGFKNLVDITPLVKTWRYSILMSGPLSVDVFFFMSGFLFCFSMQKYLNKKINKLKMIGMAFLHRYIRLLPLYLMVIYGVTCLLPYLGSGAVYSGAEMLNYSCLKLGWYNLLYVNNLVEYTLPEHMCAGHTWYLANDMQFFVLSIFIYFLLNEQKLIRNICLFLLFIASCIASTVLAAINHYRYSDFSHASDKPEAAASNFQDYYIKPWIRIGPYFIGIFFCELFIHTSLYEKDYVKTNESGQHKKSIIRKFNHFLEKNAIAAYSLFIFALLLINFAVFTPYFTNNYEMTYGAHAFFSAFHKLILTFGLGCILHLTFIGRLNWIRDLLSLSIFTRVGRLTYGVYLFHMYFLTIFVDSYTSILALKMGDFAFLALGIVIFSACTTLAFSILLESPIISLTKYLLQGNEKKKTDD